MKLSKPRTPDVREARGPENAKWADDLLAPRDAHIKQITQLLQGLLGIDNANVELRRMPVRDEQPFNVTAQTIRGPLIGAKLLAVEADDHARLLFTPVSTSQCELECIFDVLQPDPVNITFLLLGR